MNYPMGTWLPEFIFPGERIELKVMQQFHRMGMPYAEQVQVDWGGLSVELVTPRIWPPLFHHQRWTAYARVSQLSTTVIRLQAVLAGQTYTWELPVDPERVDETGVVPLLFARSAIRDWEELPSQGTGSQQRERKEASQQRQEALVHLGCRYQLMSSATSFVAIEQRPDGDKTAEIKLRRVPIALTRGWGGTGTVVARQRAFPGRSPLRPPAQGGTGTVVARQQALPLHGIHTDEDIDTDEDIALCMSLYFAESSSQDDQFVLLGKLAALQNYEGFWALEDQVVNAVDGDANQLKQIATLLNTAPEEAERIIATLLVLRFLKDRFADSKVLWQSLAQKAEQWLRNLSTMPPLTDPEPVDVVERWQTWFAQQLGL